MQKKMRKGTILVLVMTLLVSCVFSGCSGSNKTES